jgi:acyl carrier protein
MDQGGSVEQEETKAWTREEVAQALRNILVDSLGVEAGAVTLDASLVHDLGAESIDFLDISFKAHQAFGVDLPTRLIQDRILEWRGLGVLAQVLSERYGLGISAEELRSIHPTSVPAVLRRLRDAYGVAAPNGEEEALAQALAGRLISEMGGMGLDMNGLNTAALSTLIMDNLHSPKVMEQILQRFTVQALVEFVVAQLAKRSRLAPSNPA